MSRSRKPVSSPETERTYAVGADRKPANKGKRGPKKPFGTGPSDVSIDSFQDGNGGAANYTMLPRTFKALGSTVGDDGNGQVTAKLWKNGTAVYQGTMSGTVASWVFTFTVSAADTFYLKVIYYNASGDTAGRRMQVITV
jgi:hypothetical protein